MMPSKTSCLRLLEKMGMMHATSNGMSLHHEFHHELISTWIMRTKSLLPMRWLLIQHGRRWVWVSLVNQHVQLWNLVPLLRSTSIEGFMRGTTLFWWPWRCMAHPSVIWIVSLRNVFIFSTIDGRKVIYPCFFAFNFLSNVLVLLFNVL
jgi:hypothetical protein